MPNKNRPMPDREVRYVVAPIRTELRAEGDKRRIVGHASVFDQWTTLYEGRYWTWREIVRPGAFRNALAENQDVVALLNHDANFVLGRSSEGTALLSEDATGLATDIDPPDVQWARDLGIQIDRRDFKGMSFAFRVRPNGDRTTITMQGEKEVEERELLDLDLLDVSVVTRPAYLQTDVAVRSLAEFRDRPHRDPWLDRAYVRLRLAEAQS